MSNSIYNKAKIIGKRIKIYNECYCNRIYFDVVNCWTVGNELCFLIMNKILGRTEFLHLSIGNELLNNLKHTNELIIYYYLSNEIQRLLLGIECIDDKTYIAYNILGFKSGKLVSVDCDYTSIKEYNTKEFGWVVYATDGIISKDSILITENKTYIKALYETSEKRILIIDSKKADKKVLCIKEVDKCSGLAETEVVE